jgi:hypothetical protein
VILPAPPQDPWKRAALRGAAVLLGRAAALVLL